MLEEEQIRAMLDDVKGLRDMYIEIGVGTSNVNTAIHTLEWVLGERK